MSGTLARFSFGGELSPRGKCEQPDDTYERKLLRMRQKEGEAALTNKIISFKREAGNEASFEAFIGEEWPDFAIKDEVSGATTLVEHFNAAPTRKIWDEVKPETNFEKIEAGDYFKQLEENESVHSFNDDRTCQACSVEFGIITRRHHCRKCFGSFCDDHSRKRMMLPSLWAHQRQEVRRESILDAIAGDAVGNFVREQVSNNLPQRVCDSCYKEVRMASRLNVKERKKEGRRFSFGTIHVRVIKAVNLSATYGTLGVITEEPYVGVTMRYQGFNVGPTKETATAAETKVEPCDTKTGNIRPLRKAKRRKSKAKNKHNAGSSGSSDEQHGLAAEAAGVARREGMHVINPVWNEFRPQEKLKWVRNRACGYRMAVKDAEREEVAAKKRALKGGDGYDGETESEDDDPVDDGQGIMSFALKDGAANAIAFEIRDRGSMLMENLVGIGELELDMGPSALLEQRLFQVPINTGGDLQCTVTYVPDEGRDERDDDGADSGDGSGAADAARDGWVLSLQILHADGLMHCPMLNGSDALDGGRIFCTAFVWPDLRAGAAVRRTGTADKSCDARSPVWSADVEEGEQKQWTTEHMNNGCVESEALVVATLTR
jgi:hypothetical protein